MRKVIILSFLSLTNYQLFACSCGGYGKVSLRDIMYYDFIFEGRILTDPNVKNNNKGFGKKEYQVLVLNEYFGNSSEDTLTLSTGLGSSDCGLPLNKGEKWLIFSNSDGKIYHSSSCSNSANSKSLSYTNTKHFLKKYKSKTKYVTDNIQGYKIQGQLENGKPEGRWLLTNNLDTTEILNFSNGLLDGRWTKYHERGESRTIRDFRDGISHGNYEYYNEKGALITQITYNKGLKHGPSFEYYDSGELYRKSEYSHGFLVEDKIIKLFEEESNTNPENIDFTQFKKELKLTLNKPDLKWAFPNSVLISPDNKYFLVSYDFNPTFFELYEISNMKKVNEFRTRGHAYLSSSYFNNDLIYIDIGKRINIGKEKTQFMTYDLSNGQMEKVKCENSPLGCKYPISSPYRNNTLKEFITSDKQLMFKIENSVVNVFSLTK